MVDEFEQLIKEIFKFTSYSVDNSVSSILLIIQGLEETQAFYRDNKRKQAYHHEIYISNFLKICKDYQHKHVKHL